MPDRLKAGLAGFGGNLDGVKGTLQGSVQTPTKDTAALVVCP